MNHVRNALPYATMLVTSATVGSAYRWLTETPVTRRTVVKDALVFGTPFVLVRASRFSRSPVFSSPVNRVMGGLCAGAWWSMTLDHWEPSAWSRK